MNFYETMYVVHPAIQSGRLDDTIIAIDNKVKKMKGENLYFENLGKRKLAYAINKQKYGTYILLQFSIDSDKIKELSGEFEHNENILRYLISRIEKNDILEQKNKSSDVDTSSSKNNPNKDKVDATNDGAATSTTKEDSTKKTQNIEEK